MAKETGGNSVTWTPDKLLEASKQVTGIVNSIAVMMKSVKEVDGFKDIKKTATAVSKGVTDYVIGLSDLAKTLSELKGTGLDVLTERFEAETEEIKDKDGKTIKVNKKNGDVKILTAIKSIGDIISTMAKSMNDLANMDSGPIAAMKIKMNMDFLFSNMEELLDYIVETFGKGFDEKKRKALETLITKPQYVEKTTEKTGTGETAKEVVKETTKGGEVGLFDVIKAFFDVAACMNNIQVPNIIKFKIGMKLLGKEFDELIKYMIGLSGQTQALTKPGEMLKGSDGKDVKFDKSPIESLQDFFEKSEDIFEKFEEFGKTLAIIGMASKLIGKGVKTLDLYTKVFEKIGTICAEVNKIYIDDESVEKIEKLTGIVKNLATIALWGSLLIMLAIPATLGIMMTVVMVGALWLLSKLLIKGFDGKNYDQIAESIKNLKEIIKDLTIIAALVALTGLIIIGLWPFIIAGLLGVVVIIFAMKLILKMLTGRNVKKDLEKTVQTFKQLALIITIASGLVVMMALLGLLIVKAWALIFLGMFFVGIMLVALWGVLWVLQHMEKDITKGALILVLLAACLYILTLTVIIMVLAGKLIYENWLETLIGFGALAVMVLAVIGIFFILNHAKSVIIEGAIMFAIIAVSLLVISVALIVLAGAGMLWERVSLKGIGKMIAVIGGFVAIAAVAGNFSGVIFPGAVALMVLSVAMLLLGVAMIAIVGAVLMMDKVTVKASAKFFIFLGGLVAAVTGIGLVFPLVVLGSAAVLVFSVALLMLAAGMAAMLGTLTMMPADADDAMSKLKTVIDGFIGVLLTFANPLNMAALGLAMPSVMLFTVAAVSTLIAIKSIKTISEEIKTIDTTALSEENIKAAITSPIANIISAMNDIDTLEFLGAALKMKIVADGLVEPIRMMIDVVRDLVNLTVKEYDADGKVKNIRQITSGDFELAKAGIVSIVTSLGNAISGPEVMKALNSAKDLSKKALEKLKLLVDPVSGMVEAAQGLAEILQKNKDYFNADEAGTSQFSNGLKSVVSAFSALVDKEGPLNEDKLDVFSSRDFAKAMDDEHLGALIKLTKELGGEIDIKKHTEATGNFVKLIEKVNVIDTRRIKSATDMFREMKEFSESINGNFEKLADVLNEKLIDALEKLNGTLKGTSEKTPQRRNFFIKEENAVPVGTTEKEEKKIQKDQSPVQNNKSVEDILKQVKSAVSALEDIRRNTKKTQW